MGQSTNAIIGWGYVSGEESNLANMVWEAKMDKDSSLTWEDQQEDGMDSYDLMQSISSVEIDTHCHCDYPMLYFAIPESHSQAYRGSPNILDQSPENLVNTRNIDQCEQQVLHRHEFVTPVPGVSKRLAQTEFQLVAQHDRSLIAHDACIIRSPPSYTTTDAVAAEQSS